MYICICIYTYIYIYNICAHVSNIKYTFVKSIFDILVHCKNTFAYTCACIQRYTIVTKQRCPFYYMCVHHVHVCMVRTYTHICVYTLVRTYTHICVYTLNFEPSTQLYIWYMYSWVYIYIYKCICRYECIYVCIYIL